jgi:hypothetical protein
VDIYTRMNTHLYEHTHPTHMSIFERLRQIDLEIHKIDHQEHIAVDETSPLIKRIINRKCNTYVKSKI